MTPTSPKPDRRPIRKDIAERIEASRRSAVHGQCQSCGARILCGLDDDVGATNATADAEPVSLLEELAAVLAGRDSYDLIGEELHRRDTWRQCQESRWPIHLSHTCENEQETLKW